MKRKMKIVLGHRVCCRHVDGSAGAGAGGNGDEETQHSGYLGR